MLAALLALATQAVADPPITSGSDIVVAAPGKPFRIELRDLRRAEEAFARDRPRYAPAAALHFRLSPRGSNTLAGFQLALTDGRQSQPVPIDAAGDLQLPPVPRGNWSLIGNRPGVTVRFRALVLSPGTAEGDRRLGDLRLQCRVTWAFERAQTPLVAQGIFNAAGGCASTHFGFYDGDDRTIEAASVEDHGRTTALPIAFKGKRYRMPLTDKAITDEARVRVIYR